MAWKAWLVGHAFNLETLSELSRSGDPLAAQDPSDGYYVESSTFQALNDQRDLDATEALRKCINGVGLAADQGFRPVRLARTTHHAGWEDKRQPPNRRRKAHVMSGWRSRTQT